MVSALDFQAGYRGFEFRSGRDNFQTISTPSSYSTCPGLSIKWTWRRLVTDSGTKYAWMIHESKAVQIHVPLPLCASVALKLRTTTTTKPHLSLKSLYEYQSILFKAGKCLISAYQKAVDGRRHAISCDVCERWQHRPGWGLTICLWLGPPWFNYWFSFTLAYSRISQEYSSLFIIVINLIFMFSL